jgi:hypothetical protein
MHHATRFLTLSRSRNPFRGNFAGRRTRHDGEAPGLSVAPSNYTLISTALAVSRRCLLRM